MKRALILAASIFTLITGAAAQGPQYPYSVGLSWTLSTSTKIASQNMYRAPFTSSCGVFSKLTTTPLAATTTNYADANPPEGGYCYAVTATNTNGSESGFSNIDSNLQIPPPPPTGLNATVAKLGNNYEVIYAWTASKSPQVTGYSVLCGPKAGGPYSPMVTVAQPWATRVGIYRVPAQAIDCVATATSPHGQSGKSNEVAVIVP